YRDVPSKLRAVLQNEILHVTAVLAVTHRRDLDRDLIAELHHVLPPAAPEDVVAAVPFVLDVAFPLVVLYREDELDVRVRDTDFLHHAVDAHGLREIELRRRMVRERCGSNTHDCGDRRRPDPVLA